jgi:hypothetical protein
VLLGVVTKQIKIIVEEFVELGEDVQNNQIFEPLNFFFGFVQYTLENEPN